MFYIMTFVLPERVNPPLPCFAGEPGLPHGVSVNHATSFLILAAEEAVVP